LLQTGSSVKALCLILMEMASSLGVLSSPSNDNNNNDGDASNVGMGTRVTGSRLCHVALIHFLLGTLSSGLVDGSQSQLTQVSSVLETVVYGAVCLSMGPTYDAV